MRDVFKMGGFVIGMIILAGIVRSVAMTAAVGAVNADASYDAWRDSLPVDLNLIIALVGVGLLAVIGLVGWRLNVVQKQALEKAKLEAREESKRQSEELIRFD